MRFGLDNRSYVGWFKGGWYLGSADRKGLAYLTPPDLMRYDAHALHARVVNALRRRGAMDVWSDPFVRLLRICEAAMQAREATEATRPAEALVSGSAISSYHMDPVDRVAEAMDAIVRERIGVAVPLPAQCPHCYTRPDPSDARACCPRAHEEREAARAQRRAAFDSEVVVINAMWVTFAEGYERTFTAYVRTSDGTLFGTLAHHPIREQAIEALWERLEEEAGR